MTILFVLSLCLKARNVRLEDGASRLSPGPDGKALHPHFPLVPAEAGTQFSFCKIGFPLVRLRAPRFVGLKVMAGTSPAMTTGAVTFSRIFECRQLPRVSVRCVLNLRNE